MNTFKILISAWLGAIVAFAITVFFMIPREASIDSKGELGEVLSSAGILVFVCFALLSIVLIIVSYTKNNLA